MSSQNGSASLINEALKNLTKTFGMEHFPKNLQALHRLIKTEKLSQSPIDIKELLKDEKLNLLPHDKSGILPISLFPKTISSSKFSQLYLDMPLFNKLACCVSNDLDFMKSSLKDTMEKDSFTERLFNIYEETFDSFNETPVLMINRSDYIFDSKTQRFMQVEINTISCSFPGISPKVYNFHRKLVESEFALSKNLKFMKNEADDIICEALYKAAMLKKERNLCQESIIIMVIKENESDLLDHKIIQNLLLNNYGIKMIKLTLKEVIRTCYIRLESREMVYLREILVAVVYYRTGYSPEDYPSELEWEARKMVEKSSTIKCPSVACQLAGTKKIQQMLTKTDCLRKFLGEEEAKCLEKYFTEIYGFNKNHCEDNKQIVDMALRDIYGWILKPQREGGGNNLHGEDMKKC